METGISLNPVSHEDSFSALGLLAVWALKCLQARLPLWSQHSQEEEILSERAEADGTHTLTCLDTFVLRSNRYYVIFCCRKENAVVQNETLTSEASYFYSTHMLGVMRVIFFIFREVMLRMLLHYCSVRGLFPLLHHFHFCHRCYYFCTQLPLHHI